MNAVLDRLLVAAVLIGSALYATYALGPRSIKARVALALKWAAAACPRTFGMRAALERLATAAAGSTGSCGGCNNCGAGEQEAGKPAAGGAEVRVSIHKIGRRG